MDQLKEISPDTVEIPANGKIYRLYKNISIARFQVYQKLEVEVAYQGGFAGVMKSLKKGIEHLNKMQLVDAAVELSNTMDCMRKADKDKRIPSIDLCSLFLCTEDEDRRYITDELLQQKQDDFEKEGIPMDFFLRLAGSLMIGYREHLNPKELISSLHPEVKSVPGQS